MKRRDYLKIKAYQDFIDSVKEKCDKCGKWAILNERGLCDDCSGEDGLLETKV